MSKVAPDATKGESKHSVESSALAAAADAGATDLVPEAWMTKAPEKAVFVSGGAVLLDSGDRRKEGGCFKRRPFRYEDALSFEDWRRVSVLRQLLSMPFQPDNDAHEAKLLALWVAARPKVPLAGRKTKQWREIGFQGDDPATDFRGGGVFALDCMLYFSKMHPKSFRAIVDGAPAYGFALGAINIVWMLKHAFAIVPGRDPLGTTAMPNKALYTFAHMFAAYPGAFESIFCATMELVDNLWRYYLSMRPSASVMEFQRSVLQLTPPILADTLAHTKQTATLEDFRERLLSKGAKAATKRYTAKGVKRLAAHSMG